MSKEREQVTFGATNILIWVGEERNNSEDVKRQVMKWNSKKR